MLAAILALASARTFAIDPIKVELRLPFPYMKQEEAAKLAVEQMNLVLKASLEKENRIVVLPGEPAQRTIQLELTRLKQTNRSRRDIMNDPNGGASLTEVTVMLGLDGGAKMSRKGTARGSYIGTTDRSELSGTPEAKDAAVRYQAIERAKAIGRAVWDAIKFDVLKD